MAATQPLPRVEDDVMASSELAPVYGAGRKARVLTTDEFRAVGVQSRSELSEYMLSGESNDAPPFIRRAPDYSR